MPRATRADELRRCGALLQSDARHLHRWRAAAAPRSRGARRARSTRAIRLKYITLITHGGDAHAGARALALGGAASTSSTSRSTTSTNATTWRAAFPASRAKIFDAVAGDARARHRQHPLQHRDQERQSRPDPADRASARRSSGAASTSASTPMRRTAIATTSSRDDELRASSTTSIARAARVQAAPARRDHELRLLPRADSALRARRDARAVPLGHAHDPHRSRRAT